MIHRRHNTTGFTLVEMVVVAPIVILAISAFIALIVNLTGEVLSSRGSNTLTYNVQDALNRIEADVKLSSTTLAVNSIPVTAPAAPQGYVTSGTSGGDKNFTNVDRTASGGSPASLILNTLVTNGNPLSDTTTLLYLRDSPNSCTDINLYSKNTPLSSNIVYYIANNTLWRRTIMPSNYATASALCGGTSWQRPSCFPGTSYTFCKTSDEKLVEGVAPGDFSVSYFNSANAAAPLAAATNPGTTDADRNTALQAASTIKVSIKATQTIAGRDITYTGALQVTRLDTNATAIAPDSTPTDPPAVRPTIASTVYDGHRVRFTWNQVPTATGYDLSYTVTPEGGSPTNYTASSVNNDNRKLEVTIGDHTDTVVVSVSPKNAVGAASATTSSVTIPRWAPLILKGSWTEYGSTQNYATPAYTKTKAGIVMVKGLVKNPASPASGSTIGTLPSDYVPNGGSLMFGTSTSVDAPARVDVTTGGNINMVTGGNGTWFSLESIRYNSSATGRVTPALLNGFTNNGGGWAPASYVQDSTGMVSIQGLLLNGTRTSGTQIFTLPTALQPSLYHIESSQSNTFHHLGISSSGLLARGDGTGAYSINTQYYPAGTGGAWQNLTFQNSWTNFSASYTTAQCSKSADGVVSLRGLVKGGTSTYGTVLATVPCGKPKQRLLMTTAGNGAYARIDILPNSASANADILYMGTNATWYSLDGLSYIAE